VTKFGAFVTGTGFKGLVHISRSVTSGWKKPKKRSRPGRNQAVVINVDPKKHKIGLCASRCGPVPGPARAQETQPAYEDDTRLRKDAEGRPGAKSPKSEQRPESESRMRKHPILLGLVVFGVLLGLFLVSLYALSYLSDRSSLGRGKDRIIEVRGHPRPQPVVEKLVKLRKNEK
jgi:predicted RNA-binding protein with RPS1 domain